jgi:2-polyprenyl-3-methyl-5-hydroxy-6-metoxy-1,4-benzoquinol methylase/glycosyltransferase involved in cell wall biosynthesis
MYCLSYYQKDQYLKLLPEIEPIMETTSNGVDMGLIELAMKGVNKKHKIMYTSRPERGLYKALDIYEKLGDKTLELLICNYNTIDNEEVRQIEQICSDKMTQLINQEFKISAGQFTKKDLYKHIAESKAVIYPTEFPEIFCISGIEAQSCGTPFLTTNDFAMVETVSDIMLYPRDIDWVESLRSVLYCDKKTYNKACKMGREHVKNFTWEKVAKKFINDANFHFALRSEDHEGIIDRLIYESELVDALQETNGYKKEKLTHDLRYLINPELTAGVYDLEFTHEKIDLPITEIEKNTRFAWLADRLKEYNITSLLDYACHMGWNAILAANKNPDCKVIGYDISAKAIEKAKVRIEKYSDVKDQVAFINEQPNGVQFGALFTGEYLEHVLDPVAEVDRLEQFVIPNGKMFITVPKGAWESLSELENIKHDLVFHVHGFDYWDIVNMFGNKKDFKCNVIKCLDGRYGESMGNYLIEYTVDGTPTGKRDIERKMKTYRPYQSISACIIAKDAAKDIENMLDTIVSEVDEIIVVIDKNSDDDTKARCLKYPKVKVFDMPQSIQAPDYWGFANARKWILWIDTDERMFAMDKLRKYLDSVLLNAYVIKQHHAQLDNFIEADSPHRLFRKGKGQFEGFIHEQPQSFDDINESIEPSLILAGFDICNMGALNEPMRRDKALNRNLPLLAKDVKKNVDKRSKEGLPIRKLSIVLLMRDFINRMHWNYEKFKTYQTKDVFELCIPKLESLYYGYLADQDQPLYKELGEKHLQQAYEMAGIGEVITLDINGKKITKRIKQDKKKEFFQKIIEAI